MPAKYIVSKFPKMMIFLLITSILINVYFIYTMENASCMHGGHSNDYGVFIDVLKDAVIKAESCDEIYEYNKIVNNMFTAIKSIPCYE